MALSNTAAPKYYTMFQEAVKRGEIPVNQEISMQMNRIDQRIADPRFFYDPGPVEGYILFCENELTLTDGSDMEVLPTFKLWAEDLLCWFYYETRQIPVPRPGNRGIDYVEQKFLRRLTTRQYLIVGRGAAKSLYESSLQAYFLNCDPDTTQQVTTSPTMKQADEIMSPIRTAIVRARGPVFKLMTMNLAQAAVSGHNRPQLESTKKGIENRQTNSILEVRPMTIDKLQGSRAKYWTIDEWLSGDVREDVIGAAEQGASKNDDYLIVAVSSEGTVRNGVGDNIKMELISILRGEYPAPMVSIWHYKLDNPKEVKDPAMWPKAQPNIGITVPWRVYQQDVDRMDAVPSSVNDILAKRFGIPMAGHTFFFTYEETLVHRPQTFWQMPCVVGADLSQGDDFCAFTFLFPLGNDRFGVKTRSYISSLTLKRLPPATRELYDRFIAEGTLHIMDCTVLDMEEVYEDLDRHIEENGYEPVALGYDLYNSEKFVKRWNAEYNAMTSFVVRQGVRTETVPLGELKILARERKLYFDELMMQWTMGNSVVEEDTNGNRKLVKNRREEKIDNVSALMDAYVAFNEVKEAFA